MPYGLHDGYGGAGSDPLGLGWQRRAQRGGGGTPILAPTEPSCNPYGDGVCGGYCVGGTAGDLPSPGTWVSTCGNSSLPPKSGLAPSCPKPHL